MRHNSPFLLLLGQNEFSANTADSAAILNICMKNRTVYRDLTVNEDGRLSLWCTPLTSYILKRECSQKGIELRLEKRRGLPKLLRKQKHRWGLLLGAVLSFILILVSDNYIWDIRFEGNDAIGYRELADILNDNGLYVGSKINELDVDEIETLTLLDCDKISWIAINIIGTHANIEVRAAGEKPKEESPVKPSNLIAARDGVIDHLELFGGNAVVRAGDTVRAGDILVSGVWDSNHYGLFVTRSSGKVYARTERTFRVEIPFEYEKKVLKETKTDLKSLIFFSKEIKLFKNGGNDGSSCDTIESVNTLHLPDGSRLPLGTRTVKTLIYETSTERYTENEAMEAAYYRLARLIDQELSDGQILKKRIEYEITDDAYILICTVTAVENIAVMQEFEFSPSEGS